MAPAAGSATPVVAWHGVREAPVVLVTGPETFLAERTLSILTERLRRVDPMLEVTDLDAGAYSEGELFTHASPSLFGEPRLIRVAQAEKCTDAFLADALRYLEDPAEGVVLVVRHSGGNRGKKLLDALKSQGSSALVVECKEVKKDSERVAFIHQEFSATGVPIAEPAVRALADAFSSDLAELASACQQLASDSQGQPVTVETVNRYYGGRVEATTFQIADTAIAGDAAGALIALRHALNHGAEPVMIVAAFAMKLRQMAQVGGAGGSVEQVAGQLGMAPWMVRNARSSLRGWDEAGLGTAITEVAAADAGVKGQSRDPHYALERMVRIVAHRGKDPVLSAAG